MKRTTGRYELSNVAGEEVEAFIPSPLPPQDLPLNLQDEEMSTKLDQAEQALVRLELAGEMVPSLDWFIYGFVRKEAVVSSQIEGTQATLVDLLTFEAREDPSAMDADVEEVCNYIDGLTYAREQLADPKGLPVSMRLLNEVHRRLMNGARGAQKQPWEIRRSQNWIGGLRPSDAAFVPPPPHLLSDILALFEKYIHVQDELPPLIRAGLLHVQFETIHPYLDGNGRIGRLLVTLLLEQWGLLTKPLLYLSLHFKRNRQEYYQRLDDVRRKGDWEGWLLYFLSGVATIADEAVFTARDLFSLVARDRERVLGRSETSVAAIRLFELLPRGPIVSSSSVIRSLGVSKPTAGRAIQVLSDVGLLHEVTGKKRDRSWVYQEYLNRLRVGTER